MKAEFQARPESKKVDKSIRPVSRYSNPDMAKECFKKGKEQQQNGAFQKAIDQYLRALMYDPRYFQAYCNMGSCYRAQSKYLLARSMYLKAISIKPDDAISHYNLANVLRLIGDYELSITHYELVLSLAEKDASLASLNLNSLVNLGICYKTTNQYDRAIEFYERARKIDPNDQSVLYNQAMAYVASIQTIDTNVFFQVSKERAEKAQALFRQVLKADPKNQMAALKLLRVSTILDKSNANLNQIVARLKEMLANQSTTVKYELNEEMGYVLSLLKEYEKSASHYEKSMTNLNHRKSSAKATPNIYDTEKGFVNDKISVMTQEEALKMLQDGLIEQVQEKVSSMQEGMAKRVVEVAIELELSQKEEESEHVNKALAIFNQYFKANNEELPFDKLSIDAHKVIGKLLSKIGKYKDSIKHFQYISAQLKSNEEKSKVHSSLGNDYQALGDKEKALQEYKLALQEEPDNYELVYNVGCCLHEAGNHAQSNQYFSRFLELIERDTKLYLPTKNLYIADCLVTMAGASTNDAEEYALYERAWKAIQQVQQGQENQLQFESEKLMSYYLRWADLLQERMVKQRDQGVKDNISVKETLLQVYMNLLEIPGCPDRDAILNNCAILYYQEQMYVNALANLNQVAYPSPLSLNSLALTYFHLGEHFMATKAIFLAADKDPNDPLISFNKQLIEWVYGIIREGRLAEKISNADDSNIIARWQYAVLLVDALSIRLKEEPQQDSDGAATIITKFIDGKDVERYLSDIDKRKFQFVSTLLSSMYTPSQPSNIISTLILNQCKSNHIDVQRQLKSLLSTLQSEKCSEAAIELALNTFIFAHKDHWRTIRTFLETSYHDKKDIVKLDLDRKVTISEAVTTKQFIFNDIEDIVSNFCSWQCQVQDKLIALLKLVEKHYYHCRYRQLLEIQHHFPRHNETSECSITLNRVITILTNVFKLTPTTKFSQPTFDKMKQEIIEGITINFDVKMRSESFIKMGLGEHLTVFTAHANFQTREECLIFVKELQKESSSKREIDFSKHSETLVIVLSGIITISCTWSPRSALKTAIKGLLSASVDLPIQSVLQIDENWGSVLQQGGNWQCLREVSWFNY